MDSVLEQICQAVLTQLQTIVAGADYSHTPKLIKRPTKVASDITIEDGVILLVQDDPEEINVGNEASEIAERDEQSPLRTWRQTFGAVCYVRPSDTSNEALYRAINNRTADVQKAVMRGTGTAANPDPTWGGLALGTVVRPTVNFPGEDGSYAGAMCVFEVNYTVDRFDPFKTGDNSDE